MRIAFTGVVKKQNKICNLRRHEDRTYLMNIIQWKTWILCMECWPRDFSVLIPLLFTRQTYALILKVSGHYSLRVNINMHVVCRDIM